MSDAGVVSSWITTQNASARALIIVGFIVGLLTAGFWSLFIAAEILSDPGGVTGLLWVAAWLVPMAVLILLTLFAPGVARVVLMVLVGMFVIAIIATIIFANAWNDFENTHGPVSLVVAVALATPLVLLGRARPYVAGLLLVITVVVPIIAAMIAFLGVRTIGGGIAMITVGIPFLVSAGLYLVAARMDRDA